MKNNLPIKNTVIIKPDDEPVLDNEKFISNEQLELLNIYNKLTMNDKYILLSMARLLLGRSDW
ncbi:hypothetical protein [Moraxella nonliquefaciens]|jgi:hypothetical protein|uniref:hypothetical protein n=1 Tax=Moraxella nonliquefaciens TaxID=478 RepID=UPI00081D9549|nr:hypothetical protein [Moraxella nonliquefaciens]OBX48345.1 hypothetical protein A9Z65_03695 [Moraxella nonliquefaciens]